MNTRTVARIFSAIVSGLIWYLAVMRISVADHARGKEGFLVYQGQRFDRLYANPHIMLREVFSAILFMILVIGVYEVVALGIYTVIRLLYRPDDAPPKT